MKTPSAGSRRSAVISAILPGVMLLSVSWLAWYAVLNNNYDKLIESHIIRDQAAENNAYEINESELSSAPGKNEFEKIQFLTKEAERKSLKTKKNQKHSEMMSLLCIMGVASLLFFTFPLLAVGLVETRNRENIVLKSDGTDSSFRKFVDVLMGKHQVFKNSVRGWLLVQSLFATNLVLSFACATILLIAFGIYGVSSDFSNSVIPEVLGYPAKNITNTFLGLFAAYGSLFYWVFNKLNSDFASKWMYCEKALELYLNSKERNEVLLFRFATLALTMDLWSRRIFAPYFYRAVKSAIETCGKKALNQTPEFLFKQLHAGQLRENEIERLLRMRIQLLQDRKLIKIVS